MSSTAGMMLLLIGGFVWGGFISFLLLAIRRESRKARERAAQTTPQDEDAE